MRLTKPTYLIAELSGDVVDLVREMRSRFNPDNIFWPADITIAGSSGVGTFQENHDLESVVETLSPIMTSHQFTEVTFLKVDRFPGTGIYYLAPERDKFDCLHQATVKSGIKFNESQWPYNPHCTLCWQEQDKLEYRKLFEEMEIPSQTTIECFSLYQPEKLGGIRVHRF